MDYHVKTKEEKQQIRQKLIKKLYELRKIAYSGVTCREYDAINVAITIMEVIYNEEERKIDHEKTT